MTRDAVNYLPYQDPAIASQFPEIPPENFEQTIHFIQTDGSVFVGAEAVFRSLAVAGRERWLLRLYEKFPAFADLAELLYGEVADHRVFLSTLDKIYSGPGTSPLSYIRVRFLFMRGLALVYLVAFWSLFGQIQGLSGSHGIMPIQTRMAAFKNQAAVAHLGISRYYLEPTFAWWNSSDASLNWQCGLGVALSVLLLLGIAPAPALFLLWCLYLSLTTVCVPFLEFQWDLLLLETGFLAIFFAPLQWIERPSRQGEPSAVMLWLLRWLMFRLMLESGCVKLLSSDISWWQLTALPLHYETQPLPTWIAWYAHQLPAGFQKFSTLLVLLIEIAGPGLIFAGRKARLIAAGIFAALQVLILLTGNYTFFNWLTILLCLPLLDDRFLTRRPSFAGIGRRWSRSIILPLGVLTGVVTMVGLLGPLGIRQQWSRSFLDAYALVQPMRSFNTYGLFSVMTRTRPEIIIEGSADGKTWLPYEFKYKPGDLKQRPAFVAPFQPRLDWQMWFAALGTPPQNPWFVNLMVRLLQNSPPTVALLRHDPFPMGPPKFIRAQLYEYHFTDAAMRHATGQWWRREYLGPYLPELSVRGN